MREIKMLTNEEIQTLQVDAALRIIGENTTMMIEVNNEIGRATAELGQARIKLEKLKEDKKTLIEVNRALKTIVQNG
jgi:hypothetical protein